VTNFEKLKKEVNFRRILACGMGGNFIGQTCPNSRHAYNLFEEADRKITVKCDLFVAF
jgi:hypothetical protein